MLRTRDPFILAVLINSKVLRRITAVYFLGEKQEIVKWLWWQFLTASSAGITEGCKASDTCRTRAYLSGGVAYLPLAHNTKSKCGVNSDIVDKPKITKKIAIREHAILPEQIRTNA